MMDTSVLSMRPFLWNYRFTRLEKVLLIFILVSALFPYPFKIGNMLEITTAIFVILSPLLISMVRRNLHFLIILGFPLIIGQILGTGGLAEKTTILVYLKFCIYMCFIGILALRCRHPVNRRFFLMWIVVPLAVSICVSVWVDLYTNTPLFAEYQSILLPGAKDFAEVYDISDITSYLEYRNYGSGLAQRPWQVAPWAMCALIALMTLRSQGDFKSRWFWPLFIFLLLTPLLLPHRNAVIMLGTGVVSYFILSWVKGEEKKWVQLLVGIVIIITFFAGSQLFFYTLTSARPEENLTALLKWGQKSDFSLTLSQIDGRVNMFIEDAKWLIKNPIFLFFGTGYNIVLTPSVKPHNLYIAIVTASGLFGLITLLFFLRTQITHQVRSKAAWHTSSAITKAGILSLALAGMADSYLTSRLGVPAFFMTLWLALCVIAAPQAGKWLVAHEKTWQSNQINWG